MEEPMTDKSKTVKVEEETQLALVGRPAELYKQATDVAGVCKQIVVKTAITIKGNKYVKVEGWEAIAAAHGFVAGARDVERVDTGWKAVGELRRISDGTVIATAEGFVGDDEPMWAGNEGRSGRSEYAIRAMAQTRAISRVCRSAFAHVVVLMDEGLSTTPAEEVPSEGFGDKHTPMREYEQETVTVGDKATDDLLELSVWLNENNIPEGFALAMLKEKKLVAPNLTKLGNAPPGVIRRTLQSRERLLKAFENSSAVPEQSQGKPLVERRANVKAYEDEDQSAPELREPCQEDVTPDDLLAQEGEEDWRTVSIHFGKQKGVQLGKIGLKSLTWWIENWHPEQWKGRWNDKDLLLDAALCVAHAEMRNGGDE
jgi:hypothetical protein